MSIIILLLFIRLYLQIVMFVLFTLEARGWRTAHAMNAAIALSSTTSSLAFPSLILPSLLPRFISLSPFTRICSRSLPVCNTERTDTRSYLPTRNLHEGEPTLSESSNVDKHFKARGRVENFSPVRNIVSN